MLGHPSRSSTPPSQAKNDQQVRPACLVDSDVRCDIASYVIMSGTLHAVRLPTQLSQGRPSADNRSKKRKEMLLLCL